MLLEDTPGREAVPPQKVEQLLAIARYGGITARRADRA
jgi:hypothetical protein